MNRICEDALAYLPADDSYSIDLVPLWPRLGCARFLLNESAVDHVVEKLRVAFELATVTNDLHCTVQFLKAPAEMLIRARGTIEDEIEPSREAAVQVLLPWIISGHKIRPVLQLHGQGLLERRADFLMALGQFGLSAPDGTLACLAAPQLSQFLRTPTGSHELGLRQCVVVHSLASASEYWSELIPQLALRIGVGRLFLLLDERRAAWERLPRYREMLWGSVEDYQVGVDPVESASSAAHADTRGSEASDRELVFVVAGIVARHFGVSEKSLYDRRSDTASLKARQAAIYVARTWKRLDFQLIGSVLGERTSVSASQAYHRIQEKYASDPELARKVDGVLSDLKQFEHGLQETN